MNRESADNGFPSRRAVQAALALIGFALLAVLVSRLTAVGVTEMPAAAPVTSRALVFQDLPNGAVQVLEATEGTVVGRLEPGSGGFVRGVLRSMNRDRKLRGIPSGHAYNLVHWNDGRLSLQDPATGTRVDLEAFGATNTEAFARLLHPGLQEMPQSTRTAWQ